MSLFDVGPELLWYSNKMNKEIELFLKKVIENLKTVDPEKVFLIGSYADGSFSEESDIDLVVILDTNKIPDSYDEKLELRVSVRDSIYDLSREFPIDLIIYTRGEFDKLSCLKTSFYNEIIRTGKVVYEKAG